MRENVNEHRGLFGPHAFSCRIKLDQYRCQPGFVVIEPRPRTMPDVEPVLKPAVHRGLDERRIPVEDLFEVHDGQLGACKDQIHPIERCVIGDVGIDVLRAEEAVVVHAATCLLYLFVARFCVEDRGADSADGVGDIVEHAAPIVWAKGGIVNPGDDMSGLRNIHGHRHFPSLVFRRR